MKHRNCLAVGLLMLATSAAGQSVIPEQSRAFPGVFGFAIGDPVDPQRLRAAGFEERPSGPVILWTSQRAGRFFSSVSLTPMSGNMIGMIVASAPIARPAASADSPALRDSSLARCQSARAAIIEASFAGFPQRNQSETSTYIAERTEPGGEIAATGAASATLNCLLDPATGDVQLTLQLTRSGV